MAPSTGIKNQADWKLGSTDIGPDIFTLKISAE